MRDPLNRTAQKNVPAATIIVGDLVYRATPDGDYIMEIQEIDHSTHNGDPIFVWTGNVYALKGSGAGPNAAFLGDVSAHLAGRGEWKIRTNDTITKGVPPEEAEYQFPVTDSD